MEKNYTVFSETRKDKTHHVIKFNRYNKGQITISICDKYIQIIAFDFEECEYYLANITTTDIVILNIPTRASRMYSKNDNGELFIDNLPRSTNIYDCIVCKLENNNLHYVNFQSHDTLITVEIIDNTLNLLFIKDDLTFYDRIAYV